MINRVLIRIKVVQMLYSYLLTRSEFRIDDPPESVSRDRRYAYSAYIDLLLLIQELSGYSVKSGERTAPLAVDPVLAANKVAKALSVNDAMRSAILRDANGVACFDTVLQPLHDKIVASAAFRDYAKKKKTELADDVQLWTALLETLFLKDPQVEEAMRQTQGFTQQGMRRAVADVCATLRSYADSRQLLVKSRKDLVASLDKAYELYLSLFKLVIDITEEMERRQEAAKTKYLVSAHDLNPNTRLVDNALPEYLRRHEGLAALLKEYKVESAAPGSLLVRRLLDKVLASDIYKQYIEAPVTDFAADVNFWKDVMRVVILPSDELAEDLEDRSVYWNDDLQIMGTFFLKSLRKIEQSEGRHVDILPKYKDVEDETFGPELFMHAVTGQEQYRGYIDRFVNESHWDPERLAYMDIVIMTTAIAEIIHYPKIPVPVTVNEYVEIANHYSSEKSGAFINGILVSVIKYLNSEGIIHKS